MPGKRFGTREAAYESLLARGGTTGGGTTGGGAAGIDVIAGAGLTGGGELIADVTLNVGAGTLITVNANDVALSVGSAQYQVPVTGISPFTPAWTGLSTFAGGGLTFSGGVFAVGAGAGLTVNADDVALTTPGSLTATSTNSSTGSHTHAIDSTIARSAITITAGAGLTGGGDLTTNRTIAVGAGTLITVNADDVAVSNGSAQYQVPVTGATPFTPTWTALSTYAGGGLVFSSGVFAVGAGTLITVNANDVAISNGSAQYQVPVTGATPFTPTWTALSTFAGNGLAFSGGVFAVGAGNGITVNADDVALTTPGTLTVSTTNSASGSHTHAITSSSNPGAAASILASDASGDLTLQHLKLATTSNQVVFQSAGITGTLTWTPASSGKTITLPNLTGTMALGADTATVSSTNSVTVANHTHAVTSSSNPGTAASLLASSAAGALQLVNLTLTGILTTPRVTAAANLTIDPAGDVIFDPTGNDILPNANYDLNLGALSKKYLTLYAAELVVETLVAQETVATIGGRILVAPTTVLIADLTSVATTIDVKHNQMRNGDVVLMEANGLVEWMAVASGPTTISGGFRYTVTRNLDGTGANAWYAGDAIVNTGQTGAGFIDLYSFSAMTAPPIEYVFNYNATGAAFSANYASSSVIPLFGDGANTEINDAVYFGVANTTWENLYYNFETAAVYVATLVWEYWNGATWTAFTPTTTDFKSTGLQSTTWTIAALTGWAQATVNAIAAYWVRVRISLFTSFTTAPLHSGARLYRAKRQYGPSIVGQVRNSATFNDYSEHWAIGNLQGWYGYSTDTYGAAFGKYSATTSWLSVDATNGLRILRGAVQLAQWDISGNILIGQVGASQDNVYLTSGGIALRNNTTTLIDLSSAGVITIGQVGAGQDNIVISSGALTLRNNTTALIDLSSAGVITIGQVAASQDNLIISSGALTLRNNTTALIDLSSAGVITIGQVAASQNNVLISSGAIGIRNNTTERIGLTAAGILTIKDSGGAAVFTFDASAGAEFTKALTLGTSGGIYQGTGTFASPTTGLKIWNDSGVGRIAGYASGVLQWYANTDGKLYAGAGAVSLSANGLQIAAALTKTTPTTIHWGYNANVYFDISAPNGKATMGSYEAGPDGTGAIVLEGKTRSDLSLVASLQVLAFDDSDGAGSYTKVEATAERFNISGGLNVGTATGAATGGVSYSGDLVTAKNSTTYTGYIFVPLATQLTSTSWDGDARSTTSDTVIDLSAVFGAPAGIKAVLLSVSIRDSGAATADCWITFGADGTHQPASVDCHPIADRLTRQMVIATCDANGDVTFQCGASGSGTLDVWLEVAGYWI